jgi:uncharacterized protein
VYRRPLATATWFASGGLEELRKRPTLRDSPDRLLLPFGPIAAGCWSVGEEVSVELQISRNAPMNRFETQVDGELCVLDYKQRDGVLNILHVGVPDAVSGRGIAAELTKTALETARREGLRVRLRCTYAIAYVERHPQYRDLVDQA